MTPERVGPGDAGVATGGPRRDREPAHRGPDSRDPPATDHPVWVRAARPMTRRGWARRSLGWPQVGRDGIASPLTAARFEGPTASDHPVWVRAPRLTTRQGRARASRSGEPRPGPRASRSAAASRAPPGAQRLRAPEVGIADRTDRTAAVSFRDGAGDRSSCGRPGDAPPRHRSSRGGKGAARGRRPSAERKRGGKRMGPRSMGRAARSTGRRDAVRVMRRGSPDWPGPRGLDDGALAARGTACWRTICPSGRGPGPEREGSG
jgi:hypothetical protein